MTLNDKYSQKVLTNENNGDIILLSVEHNRSPIKWRDRGMDEENRDNHIRKEKST